MFKGMCSVVTTYYYLCNSSYGLKIVTNRIMLLYYPESITLEIYFSKRKKLPFENRYNKTSRVRQYCGGNSLSSSKTESQEVNDKLKPLK